MGWPAEYLKLMIENNQLFPLLYIALVTEITWQPEKFHQRTYNREKGNGYLYNTGLGVYQNRIKIGLFQHDELHDGRFLLFVSRPLGVCWCKNVAGSKIEIKSTIIILQHPHEEKRCLRTAPILETLVPIGQYIELKGKKFTTKRFPQLQDILRNENTIVLYPGKEAKLLDDLPPVSSSQPPYNIIILDGTWQQTKSMYYRNPGLRDLRQICLSGKHDSQYVIRTQPTEEALSTVETAAITLSTLEDDWFIYSRLIHPLKLMCDFQMNHGAVKHESKEQLILSGRYRKPLGKRTYKKLKKCGVKNENITVQELLDIAEKQSIKELEELSCLGLSQIEISENKIGNVKVMGKTGNCKERNCLKNKITDEESNNKEKIDNANGNSENRQCL